MQKLRIVIVDDHPLMREGVASALSKHADRVEVIALGSSATDAIELAQSQKPDVMLIDINMPGSGIEAVREIKRLRPDTRTMMLTVSESPQDLQNALRAGADGFILKWVGSEELLRAVNLVAEGKQYIAPELAAKILHDSKGQAGSHLSTKAALESLSSREEDIARALIQGKTNREIAEEYGLSEKTVKHYLTLIFQKISVRNRVEAVLKLKSGFNENG
jgi:two-component system, NarL family, nitrate/nitrite response regulator NarL